MLRKAQTQAGNGTHTSFVPYYTQRLSTECVMHGAAAIQKSIKSKAAKRGSAAPVA